jgi:hypothetical protein
MSLIDTILGRRLVSNEAGEQRIGTAAGVPTFGLDALSSAAYGPEAALTVLLPLGAAGLTFHQRIRWCAGCIPVRFLGVPIPENYLSRPVDADWRPTSQRHLLFRGAIFRKSPEPSTAKIQRRVGPSH